MGGGEGLLNPRDMRGGGRSLGMYALSRWVPTCYLGIPAVWWGPLHCIRLTAPGGTGVRMLMWS